jgi:Ca2+:H+ antiporter
LTGKSQATGVRSWWEKFPLKTSHAVLNWLLIFVPVAVVLGFVGQTSPLLLFALAGLAIIPLAGVLGEATEDLASHLGQGLGALLNATMGNATELIIAIFALGAGHTEVVKASLSGSIIGNILLVLGLSVLVGGWKRDKQVFLRQIAAVSSTTLFIAVVALVMPAVFSLSVFGELQEHAHTIETMSLWTSLVLIVVYALNLLFAFGTHRTKHEETHASERSVRSALLALSLATILIAVLSEILVAQIDATKQALGFSELFLGVVVVAIIGNAAEHASAIFMALENKMDLALGIAIGSSVQIALLVAPLLVFYSWLIHKPMSLLFVPLEIAGIAVAVMIVDMISSDGETTWFEGVQLLAVYLILAVAFYLVPSAG